MAAFYWAFISYSHADEPTARRLHAALETYRMPKRLLGKPTASAAVPARLFPIFRDRDELPGASDLGAVIEDALRRSRALVVVCSPHSAKSTWVNAEIRRFRELQSKAPVLAYLVSGEPSGAFPAELTAHGVEPLAADARPKRDGRRALLKIIAGIIGVPFDELLSRERVRRRQRALTEACGGIIAVVLAFGAYFALADKGAPLPGAPAARTLLDHFGLSLFRRVPSIDGLREAARAERIKYAGVLYAAGRADDWYWGGTNQINRDTWTAGQVAAAIYRAPPLPLNVRRAFLGDIDRSFAPHTFFRYGFFVATKRWMLAEPALWLATAMNEALASPGLLSTAERAKYLMEVYRVEDATHIYHEPDGSWLPFPGQPDRSGFSTYTAAVALMALLAARDAGLGWSGRTETRDKLARATARWLAKFCWSDRSTGVAHCQPQPAAQEMDYAGLTLQVYAELLRAATDGYIKLTPAMDNDIEQRVDALATFEPGGDEPNAIYYHRYLDENGKLSAVPGAQGVTFSTPAWGIECAALYLKRLQVEDAPRERRIAVQRALAHLVFDTVDRVESDKSPDLYPRTETLGALAAVESL